MPANALRESPDGKYWLQLLEPGYPRASPPLPPHSEKRIFRFRVTVVPPRVRQAPRSDAHGSDACSPGKRREGGSRSTPPGRTWTLTSL